jgi:glycosyltransferase involved in cell wall biosynthesis
MKVIQLVDGFYPLVGGGSISIRMLMKTMSDVDFEVVTNALQGLPLVEKYNKNGIIHRFPPNDIARSSVYTEKSKQFLYHYKLISELVRFHRKCNYLKKADYDLLVFNGPLTNYSFFSFDRKINRFFFTKLNNFSFIKKPKIVTLRGIPSWWTYNRIDKENEERVIRTFDNIICVDRSIFVYVQNYLKRIKQEKKVWFIHNSVDINKFSLVPLPNKKKLSVGFIGRLSIEKGINLLLKLVKKLPKNIELHLIVLDDKTIIEKTNNPNIFIYENIANENIPKYLEKMDVVFNPVLVEGISRVTLEAMSCGRPIIMLDKGDRYPVINNETGYLIKEDINELLRILEYLHGNRSELKKAGKNAREIVEREFSDEIVTRRIKKIYKLVAEGSE